MNVMKLKRVFSPIRRKHELTSDLNERGFQKAMKEYQERNTTGGMRKLKMEELDTLHTTPAYLSGQFLPYRSQLCIQSPLLGVEGAIHQHLEHYRVIPTRIYLSSWLKFRLEEQHARVKFAFFEGKYTYYTGAAVVEIPVLTEFDLPPWHAMILNNHIDRDVIYTEF